MTCRLAIGHASRPFHDTPPCGDGWLKLVFGDTTRLMLADGIGHGPEAHRIVTALADQLTWLCRRSNSLPGLDTCLKTLHQQLQQQAEGDQAAVALVDVDTRTSNLAVVSVGNIQVHYHATDVHTTFLNQHGMVGGRFPGHLRISRAPLKPAALLALFSDGLESSAVGEHLLHLHSRSGAVAPCIQPEAEMMLKRFGKSSDDASCALIWIGETAP